MMFFKKIYIVVFLACFYSLDVMAQKDVQTVNDTVEGKKFFNALDYSMQKRFRNKNIGFINERWADNTFFDIKFGVEGLEHRAGAEIGLFKTLSLGYGKYFSPVHGVKFNVNGGWALHERTSDAYMRMGAQINYLFNISAYLAGYRPDRLFEVSTILGLGYTYSKMMKYEAYHVGDVHAGLQLKLNIAPQVDMVVEPLLTLYSDGIDNYTRTNWHKYDVGYGAMMGFSYRLSRNNRANETNKNENNSFVSLSVGGQYQFSNATKEIGIFKTMGPNLQLSGGKWFMPFLGIRFSAFYGSNIWNRHFIYDDKGENIIGESSLKEMYLGTRLEAMVNLLEFTELDVNRFLAVSVLGGLEVAGMSKKDLSQTVRFAYYAFTCGLQTKYKFNDRWGVFFEPRLSLVPYTYVPKDGNGLPLMDRKHYLDNIYNLNIGVEYCF